MVLGHGVGPNFVISPLGDGLDFDAPTYDLPPTSTAFAGYLTPDEDRLTYTGGIHGAGAQSYGLRIDVPNQADFGGKFTLRQWPVPVPEPTTLGLAAVALAAFAVRRNKR